MVIQCPQCNKKYNIEGSKITEQGVKVTCPACQHQFIVRKKQEEKPEDKKKKKEDKKAEPQKPKGPACAVCGEPSTHIFKGPPPRPLCEHHYQVELEKDSRFFDEQTDESSHFVTGTKDPGATRVAPAGAGRAKDGLLPVDRKKAEPPRPPSPSPSEQDFESFEEDLDFFDGNAGEGDEFAAFADEPVALPPEKPEPPPKERNEMEDLIAPPHEFSRSEPAESSPTEPPSTFDESDFTDEAPASEEARPPEPPPPPDAGAPAEHPDPFRPDEFEPSSPEQPDSFQAEGSFSETSAGAGADEFDAGVDLSGGSNLDGSALEESASAATDESAGFGWGNFGDVSAPDSGMTSLDGEFGEADMRDMPAAEGLSLGRRKKRRRAGKAAAPAGESRGMVSAILTLAVIMAAVVGAAVLSAMGPVGNQALPAVASVAMPSWEGRLDSAGDEGGVFISASPLNPLELKGSTTRELKKGEALDLAQKAEQEMYKDTRGGYERALTLIDEALAVDPRSAGLYALKMEIVAFSESLEDDGKIVLKSRESKRALDSIDSEIVDDPVMLRSKAHVMLNDQKTAAARAYLDRYREKYPNDAIAYHLLGLTYLYQPKPDLPQAAELLEDAVKYQPALARAWWDLAEVYRKLNRQDEAIDAYNQVLMRSPDRLGTAEAMEEALREKSVAKPHPLAATGEDENVEPTIIRVEAKEEKPQGIEATGAQISRDIMEVINDTYAEIKRLDIQPQGQKPALDRPALPRPPEEAPQ